MPSRFIDSTLHVPETLVVTTELSRTSHAPPPPPPKKKKKKKKKNVMHHQAFFPDADSADQYWILSNFLFIRTRRELLMRHKIKRKILHVSHLSHCIKRK